MSIQQDREPLSAKVEPELKREFRVEAAKQNKTMSALIRELVTEEVGFDPNRED